MQDQVGVGDTWIFLIEWIFSWIESIQIQIFKSNFELNSPEKNIIRIDYLRRNWYWILYELIIWEEIDIG